MIPYYIQEAFPSDDMRNNNIVITNDSCKKDNLNEKIINFITEFINDFCNEDYRHDIKIDSYDDFCNKFWELNGLKIYGWDNLFRIYYFDKKWISWNIDLYKDDIYNNYVNKYIKK